MKIRFGLLTLSALLFTSCYNNPETSMKHPGDGPVDIHSRPSVGPGTTAGGSTAGPQPAVEPHGEGNVEPQPGGVHPGSGPGSGNEANSQPATPVHGPGATETPATGKEQTGNEQGPGRGHESQPGARMHGNAQKDSEQK
jgi:hypothetical protein